MFAVLSPGLALSFDVAERMKSTMLVSQFILSIIKNRNKSLSNHGAKRGCNRGTFDS